MVLLSVMLPLMLGITVPAVKDKDLDKGFTPMMRILEPTLAKAGDLVLVSGENLGREFVSEVYLSDGKQDQKVRITEQTDVSLKFVVPAACKPGKYGIIVLLNKPDAVLLEEPLKLTVIQ